MSDSATLTAPAARPRPTLEQDQWVSRVLGLAVPSVHAAAGAQTPGGPSPIDGGRADALAKLRQIWIATRKKVDAEVSKLKDAVVDAYAHRGLGPQLATAYQDKVAWVLTALDERLASALDDLVASDPSSARHEDLLDEAREAISDYQVFIRTDRIIDGLDKNPFGIPLAIGPTLSSTLTALAKALG